MILEGSASAGPSCSRWGGWPQSCYLTAAGGGSSWRDAGGSVSPAAAREDVFKVLQQRTKVSVSPRLHKSLHRTTLASV